MAYTDLFIAPISAAKKDDYTAFCMETQKMILGYGALACSDFWPDDVPDGKLTSLPLAVMLEDGEAVTVGLVVWPDKATRDAGWEKMMSDASNMEMPFDGKRLIFGGFTTIAETRA
ncbi:hypothetical protein PARPLA_02013 [Rhodobacteraceae bacterium THAF1]|uniref:DUF1428 domain-containing protein n=1 Tax=Palleronia sp. THAF1 TaxID=2587842 RepID=UPI000F3F843F|nr:DUF1428 domain-containing protein [Palleronia sp. THAF1]QFU08854.1 hypothetical protein FIU81_09230 [Palleronia sp. THAF1]VDC24434.1 hypothetical protein PARPLA_02013 [Rhodobacteraceae bacterium THAF1]